MKKIYSFNQCVMNGTVTLKTSTIAFPNKELAEETRQLIVNANREKTKLNITPLRICFSEVEETLFVEDMKDLVYFIKKIMRQ